MDIEKMRGAVISQVRVNREFEERIAKIEEFLKTLEAKPAEDAWRPRPMLEGGLPGECNL